VKKGLEQLEPLIGEWTSASKTFSEGRGRMTVAPTEGGKFFRVDSAEENDRFPHSTQIIGSDESGDECTVLYYDSRGVHRVYRTTVSRGEWRMWRDAPGFNQRYIAKFSRDGKTLAGQWEFSEDGTSWKVDFDLTYTKVG
jgi:hypothetical protein